MAKHSSEPKGAAHGSGEKSARKGWIAGTGIVVAAILVAWWYVRAQGDRIVIESFRVTHDADAAVDSSAAAARFTNSLLRVLNESDSKMKAPGFGPAPMPPDVEVPKTGLSLSTLTTLLSDLFGYDPVRINADLVDRNTSLTLYLRIASPEFERDQSLSIPGTEAELPALFDSAARDAIKIIAPVALAGYCRTHRRECDPTIALEYALSQPPADDDVWALNMWAAILMRDGQMPLAEQRLKHALVLQPNFPLALFNYGYLRAAQHRLMEAAEFYRRAIDAGDARTKAIAYNNLGDVLLDDKNMKGAEDAYRSATTTGEAAVGSAQELSTAYSNLGYVQYVQSRWDEAVESYERAAALNASDPTPLIGLASALEEKKQIYEALPILRMAVSADRQSSEAWFYLAEWHRQYGDKQLAITDFNAVIQLNKDPDLVKQATELRDKLAAPAEGTK